MRQYPMAQTRFGRTLVLLLALLYPAEYCSASIANILMLPEEKIDVGIVALTLAKELYSDIDVAAYSEKIDALADKVHRLARGTQDPDQRIRCLNTVLLLYEKFQGSRDSSFARKLENYYLNHVLETKQGNCVSLPLLYIAVSQRLDWPIYLVHVPDHSFVRYVDPTLKQQNIEATSNGGYVADERYAKDFLVSKLGRKSGAYLRTLTHRELLGNLVEINAIALGQRGELTKSISYLISATRLNPRLVSAWANLVNAYEIMAKRSSGSEAEKYRQLAEKYSMKLKELGFVHPKDVPQFTSKERSKQ